LKERQMTINSKNALDCMYMQLACLRAGLNR
jgi:hypothetical protein